MAKNKQQKKKEREKRVAEKKLALAARRREEEKATKPKKIPERAKVITGGVQKTDYVPKSTKSPFTQRRGG